MAHETKVFTADHGAKVRVTKLPRLIGLDVADQKGVVVFLNLDFSSARALAEWTLENLPEAPSERSVFDSLPIGAQFILAADGETRVKVTESEYYNTERHRAYGAELFLPTPGSGGNIEVLS